MIRPTKDMTTTVIPREQLLALLQGDDAMRALVQTIVQETLEAEMEEALGAAKGERTGERRGHRSGYYGRKLTTRVGTLELRVPQDRGGLFRTEVFSRYQRSEKALLLSLAEMYVQGVSTRKVRAVTEELARGHRGALRPRLQRQHGLRDHGAARQRAGALHAAAADRGVSLSRARRAL